jgi:hypothetical protein
MQAFRNYFQTEILQISSKTQRPRGPDTPNTRRRPPAIMQSDASHLDAVILFRPETRDWLPIQENQRYLPSTLASTTSLYALSGQQAVRVYHPCPLPSDLAYLPFFPSTSNRSSSSVHFIIRSDCRLDQIFIGLDSA